MYRKGVMSLDCSCGERTTLGHRALLTWTRIASRAQLSKIWGTLHGRKTKMNARRQYLPFGAVLALLTAWFTLAGPISIANAQGQSGTSLDAAVTTAVGFSETTTAFGWVTAIEAVPTDLSLSTGASGTINYTLTATRTVASQTTTS